MNCRLDLHQLALHARNAEYKPKRFAACILRIRDPKTTALIFSNGRCVITGARSIDDSRLAARKFVRIVQKIGFAPTFTDFKVQNIVASGAAFGSGPERQRSATGSRRGYKAMVRLEGIAEKYRNFTSYEAQLFAGCTFRMMKPKVVST